MRLWFRSMENHTGEQDERKTVKNKNESNVNSAQQGRKEQ